MNQKMKQKYSWTSEDFDSWLKKEKERIKRETGYSISTAGVSHKLLHEVLIPNEIKLEFPRMRLKIKVKKQNAYK